MTPRPLKSLRPDTLLTYMTLVRSREPRGRGTPDVRGRRSWRSSLPGGGQGGCEYRPRLAAAAVRIAREPRDDLFGDARGEPFERGRFGGDRRIFAADDVDPVILRGRSEERRVGKDWASPCRSGWCTYI